MNMENMSDKIIKTMQSMTGKYGIYNIFEDWVCMMAMAYANQVVYSQKREDLYLDTLNKYNDQERQKFFEMFAWLVDWAEVQMTDMLGYIYMHLEIGSKAHGQFFTPYHLCRLMAKLESFNGEIVTVNEPSCGAGGNIIALAEAMKERGINYQQKLEVVCQDIDTKAVYMTYVQMCLYGIPAIVYQSNTLTDPNGIQSVTGRLYTTGYLLKMA